MAHEELWKQLEKLDPLETAKRAMCGYMSEKRSYVITMLNREFVVNIADKTAYRVKEKAASEPAQFLELLCILTYLIHARKIPLASKLVGPQAFSSGQFFFRGPHELPTGKMVKAFGCKPERLYEVAQRFNVERCKFGDASIRLYILPRIPLTVVIWRQDQEFDARVSFLFDQTASDQLPLDALGAAVNLTADALVKAHNEIG